MAPLAGVPAKIAQGMREYRDVFCREAGFEHVSRYGVHPSFAFVVRASCPRVRRLRNAHATRTHYDN
jgi:hypothetical protein